MWGWKGAAPNVVFPSLFENLFICLRSAAIGIKPVIRLNRLIESSGASNRPNFKNQAIPEQGVVFIWDDENK